jgi:DNA-directed RNA polymerase specialized sigma24 family protein
MLQEMNPTVAREAADDNYDVLRQALASLTPRERAALVATELLGHTSEERVTCSRSGR